MVRFRFEFMDKSRKAVYLPLLFDILYANMKQIVPGGPYETEKQTGCRKWSLLWKKHPGKSF